MTCQGVWTVTVTWCLGTMNLFTFGEMKDPTRLSGPIDPEGGILIDLHIGPSPVDEDRMRASGVNVLPMRPIRAMVDPGSNRSMVQGSVLDEMGLMTYREVALASHDVEGEYKALYSYLVFLRIEGGGGHIDFLNIEVAPHGKRCGKGGNVNRARYSKIREADVRWSIRVFCFGVSALHWGDKIRVSHG
jgi:hypothetical protein